MYGFDTINEIAKKSKIQMTRTKFEGIYGQGSINRRKGYSFKTSNIYEFKWKISKEI